ncbi:MAG: NAD-glutamate dehydrogenase [Gammaproteobacteria bacterium]|nr:NAD-glutamate dehydrogenase [Gammaproteobacteria bacterium]
MFLKFEQGKEKIIDALIDKIKQNVHTKTDMCIEFAKQFYATVSLEDLMAWDLDDLYGALIHFWLLLQHRKPRETKIHIYQPYLEEHGWQSNHTIIEILMEDMPFLVDSIRMVLDRMQVLSHLVVHMGGVVLERDKKNELQAILPRSKQTSHPHLIEAPIWVQINKQTDAAVLHHLKTQLIEVLEDNRVAVEDWSLMRNRIKDVILELEKTPPPIPLEILSETKAFLTWLEDHHFTLLGVCDYKIDQKGKHLHFKAVPKTGLGILRETHIATRHETLHSLIPESCDLTTSEGMLIVSKTSWLSTIHRNTHADYIGIKQYDAKGKVIGERRLIGLYTAAAYNTNPRHIPFLRHKVLKVMQNSELNPKSHAGKILLNIIETLPRDDLIQASEDELLELAMGIMHLQERKRIRLFARTDIYNRFISCLVFVPKDRFNTEMRKDMEQVFAAAFQSEQITFSTWFTESVLARIHFVIRIDPAHPPVWNVADIEKKLIEIGRSWSDDLLTQLLNTLGGEKGNQLFLKYRHAFPSAYCESHTSKMAVYDIIQLESLGEYPPLVIHFYRDPNGIKNYFRLKVFQQNSTIPLSEVLPIVERLGMTAISERPYSLQFDDGHLAWISDFSLIYTQDVHFEIGEIQQRFQDAFIKIWLAEAENDRFNELILSAGLDWRQVSILRAYAKYFKQIGFTFSQEYIESAMINQSLLAKRCIELFEIRFNVETDLKPMARLQKVETATKLILKALDAVSNLDEDKIIRQFVNTINATLRTNYYQCTAEGAPKPYLSLKFNCKLVPNLPKPCPLYEIYLYSPRVEGVHLRGGKVARGGLRWSDRREDFRTEVLGLMKAQQVKNAIIVPNGAKGGFIPKQLPFIKGREAMMAETVASYQIFIRGLLDITDNYKNGKIVKPRQVICYDDDDPYLVVAADKGTATFSDYANEVAFSYQFWLGDAFASGGSLGYDHKKIGITARGAWESVKRHFYEMDIDFLTRDFTVVGIGDMAGDVFGNGMLLSKRIKLIAAFNHMHIFIDPNPNPLVSFKERERLFNLPRSSWADYNHALISKGGGVFDRSAKSILISKEMKTLLGLKRNNIEPNELIKAIMKAECDMLWSAGIGTFVKAEHETHSEVGDRTNDSIRVNGNELRCKLVAEGGNLGLTQQARIEYDLNGGLVYTDFVDNSAGVSCSDKEVNIKILLDKVVAEKELTLKQRNALLSSMTEEVSALVLKDNIAQTRAISLAASQTNAIDLHIRYIHTLEQMGKLDRHLEFIPDDKVLMEHKMLGKGLGLPSISVLQSYSKIILKEHLLATDVPEDPFLISFLIQAFPNTLHRHYKAKIKAHPLKREIIATRLSNMIVNEMGFAFVFRMEDETGASVSAIARSYLIARTLLGLESIWQQIEDLGYALKAKHEKEVLTVYLRLVRRMTRWVLHYIPELTIQEAVERYSDGMHELKLALPDMLAGEGKQHMEPLFQIYRSWGIPESLAHELTKTRPLFSSLDLIEASLKLERSVADVAKVYFEIGDLLGIAWIRSQVIAHPTETSWESFAREAIRDDLDAEQRFITEFILKCQSTELEAGYCIRGWMEAHQEGLATWQKALATLKSSSQLNYTMFLVMVRQLKNLTQRP